MTESRSRVYLDYAATTPLRPEALAAMAPYFSEHGYNASSAHAEGRRARSALDDARDAVARLLGSRRKEIVFTAGGTESNAMAILGVARANRGRGRHLVSTVIEHHAVLHALAALEADGFDVSRLEVDEGGRVDPDRFAAALRPDTVLASIAYANNEIGTLQPIARLAQIARERGIPFHTDAVQAAPWLPLDAGQLGVDMLTISAHKFYGPKGVGALFVREGVAMEPLVYGGGQEFGRRSGTENVAGIVGLAAALELAAAGRSERAARVAGLRDRLERRVLAEVSGTRANGAERLPNNLNLSVAGVDSEGLLAGLDLAGIAVSAGSACASGVLEPSHVIAALGLEERWTAGVIRFSLGYDTTEEEVDRAASVLCRTVPGLRGNLAPLP
ncbi:MAG: cysteine desulfurase family protein [Vulcanimicrobiaceae bacterium]